MTPSPPLSDVQRVIYDERFLRRSSEWLRDPELRYLTDTPTFSAEAQRDWFESLPGRTDYLVWGIQTGNEPIGAFGIKNVTDDEAEYWGYIGERKHWGRGIGQWMLREASVEARARGLSRLVLRVIPENVRARRAYETFGFRTVSEDAVQRSDVLPAHIMDIQTYDPSQSGVWDDFVRRSQGTFLHERGYMDYHQDRFPDASVMVLDRGKLVAVLPATAVGAEVTSHAGLTYGGLLHTGLTAAKVLAAFDALNAHYHAAGFETVLYKPVPYIYHPYPVDEDLYAMFRLDGTLVARSIASALPIAGRKRFTESRRGGLRKAERAGCVVSQSDDLTEFWTALDDNLQDRHAARPVHSLDEMTLLKRRFPHHIRLFEARVDGVFGAGCVVFNTARVAHAQYITSTKGGRASGALDALFDTIINAHCEYATMRYFDFGTSTENDGMKLNSGLIFQKEGFGGRGVVYDTYRYALSGLQIATEHAGR